MKPDMNRNDAASTSAVSAGAVSAGSASAGSASAGSAIAGSATPKVLAVDDVRSNLSLIRALLSDMDCEVVCAPTGAEALQLLDEHEFAVMLLDVQMPGMDGYEVATYARRHPGSRDSPILFLTAEDRDDESLLRGYGSGAVDYMFKPIQREILRGKVRVFLDLYLSRRQIADARDALARSNVELRELALGNAVLAERSQLAKVELEKAYHELKSTQAQLVQAAKMASLGELVAGIAHEINNPLAFAISHLATVQKSLSGASAGFGELPAEAAAQWVRATDRLQGVEMGLERIRALVVKLQNFSRLDEGDYSAVNIAEAIDSVLTIMQHRLRDRIQIETRFGKPEVIECDPSLLNQGVLNLVSNGIDAIDGPGRIVITTGAEGDNYVIRVADTGPGIPAEVRARVLEPFFTTKPAGKGTGLGLSITYAIVRKHGGTFELNAGQRGGTEAVISIPLNTRFSAQLLDVSHACLPALQVAVPR
jgi:two-component system, NtrC family, sensor kinase